MTRNQFDNIRYHAVPRIDANLRALARANYASTMRGVATLPAAPSHRDWASQMPAAPTHAFASQPRRRNASPPRRRNASPRRRNASPQQILEAARQVIAQRQAELQKLKVQQAIRSNMRAARLDYRKANNVAAYRVLLLQRRKRGGA